MTKGEENNLTMLNATWSVLNTNAEKLGPPALKAAVRDFETLIAKVKELVQQTMTATAGKVDAKASCRAALVKELMVVAKSVQAYGHRVGNAEIAGKAHVVKSELDYMRDTKLVAKAVTIYELGVNGPKDLGDYGATTAKLESLKGRSDAFEAALGDRESSVARRKASRSSFRAYMDRAKELLKEEIDNMMADFKRSDPEFYNEYVEARSVKNLGLRHRAPPAPEVTEPPRSETL